jgi:hypothetical protein
MATRYIWINGKKYFFNLLAHPKKIKTRITHLRKKNPKLRFQYIKIRPGLMALYIRRFA